jgi:hypothetical protein
MASRLALFPVSSERHGGVRYFCFAGVQHATATHVLLDRTGAGQFVKVEPKDSGDGTVPTSSALLRGEQSMSVGGKHIMLFKNDELRETLARLLGATHQRPKMSKDSLVLREGIVEAGAPCHATITRGKLSRDASPFVQVARARLNKTEQIVGFEKPCLTFSIKLNRTHVEGISLRFKAPRARGLYRVGLFEAGQTKMLASDDLIIRSRPPSGGGRRNT